MRTFLKNLSVLVLLTAPMALIAQNPITGNANIETSSLRFKLGTESKIPNPNLTVTSILPAKKDSAFAFRYQLPMAGRDLTKQVIVEQPLSYTYNMPIAKPAKTSKILIAKLDPNFPYQYNMPILKNESGN